MRIWKTGLFAAGLCCSTFVAAGTITMHWDSTPWNPNPPAGPFGYSVTTGGHTYTGSVSPDRYHGTITAASGVDPASIGDAASSLPEGLFTYCYELTQYFYAGETVVYDVLPASGNVTAYTLDFLGAVNAYMNLNVDPTLGQFGWLHPTSAAIAAAIQLGIWETEYDVGHPFDLANDGNRGNFYLTSGSLGSGAGSVGGYLAAFTSTMGLTTDLAPDFVVRLSNTNDPLQQGAGAQDQITGIHPPTSQRNDVPEPGTLALIALSAVAVRLTRERRNAQTAA